MYICTPGRYRSVGQSPARTHKTLAATLLRLTSRVDYLIPSPCTTSLRCAVDDPSGGRLVVRFAVACTQMPNSIIIF